MNRLSKWILGTGLVLMLMLVSACSSDKDQPVQPPAASETGADSGTEAQPGGTGSTAPETGTSNGSDTGSTGSTEGTTGNGTTAPDSSNGSAAGSGNNGTGAGSTDAGTDKGTSNNANPELTPETKELKISTVQQGPGQLFLRVESLPQGYKVSNMEWQAANSNETATFDQAVQNGKNGKDGFFASSDQRNFGFIYNQSHSGEQGKVTLTLRNEAGDELTWYEDVTLQ
ncbi:hypothetical protein [Paenibacillus bovis]|uniref:DUF4352 domain-containing protein n=1 Tax=Paenibacillus bovis TaxID=1616788 RepID=A0A172ZH46_9BACL|nr:hypothetical protein [Paenibacillus bovis]ANF96853.1 hypothetical protein AR543_13095 [Paenibacillus bovis]